MTPRHFILATAGHVDHGKSALVKALTGIDPDRLPEEKARGITIDLGFAHLELATSDAQLSNCHVGIVDVPGHEDFVKNMVAGVGSIDIALLVVAADDGWMPQTEEHLQILSYLGVTRAVIALTKIDLATDETASKASVREKLRDTPFARAQIVPTSIVTGRGIEELKAMLARVLADAPPSRDIGKPRLPIDRVFVLRGIGTVVTGTLIGGVLRQGQEVMVQPTGRSARIRAVQSHNQEVESSGPGTRTALNLTDVNGGAATAEQTGVQRGNVITLAGLGAASDTLDVELEKSARLATAKTAAARPLKDGTLVRVHHGSGNFSVRVHLLDVKEILPGQRALAQLRAEQPVFAFAGDRFIVRDWSEQATLAGGLVLDPDASRKGWRTETRRRFLQARADSPTDACVWIDSLLQRERALRRAGVLIQSRFSAAEVAATIEKLIEQGCVLSLGQWLVSENWWQSICVKAAQTIDADHHAHPERLGCALNDLRAVMQRDLPDGDLFEHLVMALGQSGFVPAGAVIRRQGHRSTLPPRLQAAGAKLRATLAAKPLEPPSRKDLTPDVPAQQALRFLVQTGEAVELSAELVLLTEHFQRAVAAIKSHLRTHATSTVSELRPVVGTSRRILVPLLERLDRDGVTLRQGDLRRLK
ncbi:MAG: selenocysteine-specific translation elongation factor [Verrucomicrobia bacterium]|nr:selenocysteine-specific translation elongation factor [Verrucomicrobiota bacterium]